MDNKLHNELEQKKAKHLSIDSSLGVWWIKLEDGEYYQHHTPATKKMYGYSDSQTTGKKIFSDNWKKIAKQVAKLDPTFADYHKELQKKFYELVDGVCNSTTYVSPWLNEKKELIWIEDQLTVISRNEFGKPDIIIGSSFDITKTIIIRESYSELEKSNKELLLANKRAIDMSQLLVWNINFDLSKNGDFYYANKTYQDALGIKQNKDGLVKLADFLKTGFPDKVGKSGFDNLLLELDKTYQNKSDSLTGIIVKHQNLITGLPLYLEHNAKVESRNIDGSIKEIGGYIQNITAKYELEEKNKLLADENIKLHRADRLAIKSGKVMVWFLDSQSEDSNKYFYGNDLLFEKLGLTPYGKNKFSISEFNQTIYYGDEEGQTLGDIYFDMDDRIEAKEMDSYEKLIVKHINNITNETFYLEHNFEVEERYKDGSLMIRGGFMTDVTNEVAYKKRNEYLVHYDEITGLRNRYSFEKRVSDKNSLQNYSLIMSDIDGLKFINDAFGHLMGDKAITFTADVLKNAFEKDSDLFRIGGDEFAIISDVIEHDIIDKRIKDIKTNLQKFTTINNININISVGYEIVENSEKEFSEAFIDAENLMYRRKLNERNSRKSKTMETVLETLNQKTEETKEHGDRLGKYAVKLMKALGYNRNSDLDDMKLLCQVHDIGKITISEDILSKDGPLTEIEYDKIKKHSEAGYKIVRNIVESDRIAYGVLYHHERVDGTGYPFGLLGEEITLFAKILSICDSYDVMISGRKYSSARSQKEVIEEIKKYSGTQFDTDIANVFIKMLTKKE